MNIKELRSVILKKKLGAESVCFRWHNKNKTGGNFGINIIGVKGKDYEITGYYNNDGLLRGLRFGLLYRAGVPMDVQTIDEMFEYIANAIVERG